MLIKNIKERGEEFLVQMEYIPEFIERMKRSIPYPQRKWDAIEKSWVFTKKGFEMLRNMPNVVFYEDALNEVVDTSQFNVPDPCGLDSSIDFEKFEKGEFKPYPFQKVGISRIVNMNSQGLYFECGLGKTYTSICAAKELIDRGVISQCLVVLMVSMAITSWTKTLDTLGYSYEVIEGPIKFRASKLDLCKKDFIITLCTSCDDKKYALYPDLESLKNAGKKNSKTPTKRLSFVGAALKKERLMVIADELHKLSDTQSARFKNLLKIRKHCLRATGLTGTVIKSSPEKCLLPLRFEYPSIFSNKSEFENAFTIKEQGRFGMSIVGYRNLDVLKSILHKAGMPALKEEYLPDLPELLPPKLIYCETDKISLELVDKIRNDISERALVPNGAELKDLHIRTHEALVCPSMFDPRFEATNRLQAVESVLESLAGKTVIFTTLKKAIIELYNYLTKRGFGCTCCSGDQPPQEIDRRVDKFVNDPDCSILIATIQKMGTGFDGIKIARNAIIYDFNTNAADLIQAVDRLHRNGQKNAVSQIYILQDNAISEYHYRKVMAQKELMENVEDTSRKPIESTMDLREIFELIKDSKNFLRRTQ